MGNQKQKWTTEEEDALMAGVAKHGPGKWKNIIKDPDLAPSLANRTNVDLKDKWRNLSVTSQGGSREKSKTTKIKTIVSAQNENIQNFVPDSDIVMEDASNNTHDGQNASRYNAMVFEAISTMKDANGTDIGSIFNFIEQRHETPLPSNFRKLLSSRLRRLVLQGKLEKVQNGYKIKKETLFGTKTPTPKQKDIRKQQSHDSRLITSIGTVQDAANMAAYKVADAENKSVLAAESVMEAERLLKKAEDADSMLKLLKEIYEQCSRGDVFLISK